MDYTLRRSKRRTVSVEISRQAAVIVRAPLTMPQAEIDGFLSAHEAWIAAHLTRQRQRLSCYPEPTAEEEAALRLRAGQVLPPRVAFFARQMGVSPAGITITGAKTRFGSCSGKDRLCFSYRLMRYPPEAVDYVVVHELAHIRHKNHSPAFYAEIARILPDYAARQALLRE